MILTGYIEDIRKVVENYPLILVSSVIIVKNSDSKISLFYRKGTNNLGLPGGYMVPGEKFEDTAKREVMEKIGIEVNNLTLLSIFSGREFYSEYPNGDKVVNVPSIYTT
ncbi:NUDIX domain-containing protein [Neobacillus drentensis]|uniref:NUDIX domain-containing protein n=1 Tax=Neobacillus drentensis TaxID=220684 RepID=UPI000836F16F|nr:NUDIX domain-containing protein [Neobacillus drentensis]